MRALPSIAFNDFSGTAGDVTARATKAGTVLTVRPFPSKVVTPSQKSRRNALSSISRSYRNLTDSQMAGWAELAEHLKGISTFGSAAEMTAHNAYVRINENRRMVGMSLFADAPVYVSDVPEVDYEDLWVSPSFICFTGLVVPKDSYRLVVRMSAGRSVGISSGWDKTVIVAAGVQEDWSEANITRVYSETIGYTPKLGEKVFLEFWWLDTDNGFTGEAMRISAICKEESQIEGETYVKRNRLTVDNIKTLSSGATIYNFSEENAEGSALMIADIKFKNTTLTAGISGTLKDVPDTFMTGRVYFPSRGRSRCPWAIALYECYSYYRTSYSSWQVSERAGVYDPEPEIFGTSAFVNY